RLVQEPKKKILIVFKQIVDLKEKTVRYKKLLLASPQASTSTASTLASVPTSQFHSLFSS
ncbi:hypothetical protein CSUI_004771, partial [Cystoisospora suis]